MRGLMIGCAVALVLVGANTVMAADVSNQTLAAMGINGMETVSDAQGMEVRGKGFIVFASTWSRVVSFPGQYSAATGVNAGYLGHNQMTGEAIAVWPIGPVAFAGTVVGDATVFRP